MPKTLLHDVTLETKSQARATTVHHTKSWGDHRRVVSDNKIRASRQECRGHLGVGGELGGVQWRHAAFVELTRPMAVGGLLCAAQAGELMSWLTMTVSAESQRPARPMRTR